MSICSLHGLVYVCFCTDRPEQTHQASHQGLYCVSHIQHFLDTPLGSKLYLFKFKNKCGKELRCPNT